MIVDQQEDVDELQELIDHHRIRKVLAIYCHGCDRGDGPRMASIYAANAWEDHGGFKGRSDEFVTHVMKHYAEMRLKSAHILGQSLINVIGDEAHAETYFIANLTEEAAEPERSNFIGGRYVDTLRRVGKSWEITERICVRDWSVSVDAEIDPTDDRLFAREQSHFVQGVQSGDDPSYAALGLTHPGFPLPA